MKKLILLIPLAVLLTSCGSHPDPHDKLLYQPERLKELHPSAQFAVAAKDALGLSGFALVLMGVGFIYKND